MSIRLSEKYGVNPMLGQCPLCARETMELFLLGRLPKDEQAPRMGVTQMSQPCEKCKEYMSMGVLVLVCRDDSDPSNPYRTGEIHVIKREAALEVFGEEYCKKGAVFIPESVARQIGLMKPE